jgi:hypothetical protein
MTHTTLIAVNAVLDLAVVLAIFAIVLFTHRLDRHSGRAQTIPLGLDPPAEDLSEAA